MRTTTPQCRLPVYDVLRCFKPHLATLSNAVILLVKNSHMHPTGVPIVISHSTVYANTVIAQRFPHCNRCPLAYSASL